MAPSYREFPLSICEMGVIFFYSSTARQKLNLVGKLQEMTKSFHSLWVIMF